MDMTKKKRGIWLITAVVLICAVAGTVIGCNIGEKTDETAVVAPEIPQDAVTVPLTYEKYIAPDIDIVELDSSDITKVYEETDISGTIVILYASTENEFCAAYENGGVYYRFLIMSDGNYPLSYSTVAFNNLLCQSGFLLQWGWTHNFAEYYYFKDNSLHILAGGEFVYEADVDYDGDNEIISCYQGNGVIFDLRGSEVYIASPNQATGDAGFGNMAAYLPNENEYTVTDYSSDNIYRGIVYGDSLYLSDNPLMPVLLTYADLDGDGENEAVKLDISHDISGLYVLDGDGREIYREEAGGSNLMLNNLYLCERDGINYLLRYNPKINQGAYEYSYELFSLNGNQGTVTVAENSLYLDLNNGDTLDIDKMVSFADEVNALLEKSVLLVSTESGGLEYGIDKPVSREEYSFVNNMGLDFGDNPTLADKLRIYNDYVGNKFKFPSGGWVEGAPTIYTITSDELEKYREIQMPDMMYTLCVTDVSDTQLHIVTDSHGVPYVRAIDAKGQTINFDEPVELQGGYNFHIFEASGAVVFDKLYYHSGDTWALYDGGIYEMHNGYDSDGNINYFGISLYKADDGSLRHFTIANKYDGNLEQFREWCIISCITDRADVYSESGSVYIQSDGLAFSHETAVTIADKFDLDALFGRMRSELAGEYAGCKAIDDVIAVNKAKYGLVMTEFTDENWAKLNFDGAIQEQCRKFFYNFVSGKSEIPEYNELGVTDWKITRKDDLFNNFPSFIFEFTVTRNSLDALPPGHYVKYINDIRWTAMYDDIDMSKVTKDNTDNKYAQMVYGYLNSSYIWDCCNFGEWDGNVPINYIIGQYGGSNMPYDEFLSDAKKLFGIDSFDETKYGGLIYEVDGVKVIEAGGIGGGYYADIPEVNQVGNDYEVIVQLYADINGILPSHKLKYTLGRDGEFIKFEVLEKSPYEPEGLTQYYIK